MSEIRETDLTVIETEETFTSAGARCAATVYRPRGITGPTPVVVMGHGVTLTRRDGIPAFARQFAATGCSVVAFDYRRYWGDSDGHPRPGSPSAGSSPTGGPRWRSPASSTAPTPTG